ncbi:MAG TPA: DUF488 domain-containing protein [Rhizomicrobium sp.]|jgi:uncharacterized protein YeaO (DUF488 family)|nr:DUF488 domain-containing protein [Rhizomicrobium sp.]
MTAQIKRIYEPPSPTDGYRVLVDRLWPRGISREKAALDEWAKEVAPTPELREWFDHRPERFAEFRRQYKQQLAGNSAWKALRIQLKRRRVTLLYGAKDPKINHAVVLMALLNQKPRTAKAVTKK